MDLTEKDNIFNEIEGMLEEKFSKNDKDEYLVRNTDYYTLLFVYHKPTVKDGFFMVEVRTHNYPFETSFRSSRITFKSRYAETAIDKNAKRVKNVVKHSDTVAELIAKALEINKWVMEQEKEDVLRIHDTPITFAVEVVDINIHHVYVSVNFVNTNREGHFGIRSKSLTSYPRMNAMNIVQKSVEELISEIKIWAES